MLLADPIESLPNTSPITIRRLRTLGVLTFFDLLNYFPFRYENYTLISKISELQVGETVTIKGKIVNVKNEYTKRGLKIQKVNLSDETGKIELAWFNQPYLLRLFKPGLILSISGIVKEFLHKKTLEPQGYEVLKSLEQPTIHTGRITPIYPEKNGLSSRLLREKIYPILKNSPQIIEILPEAILSFNRLIQEDTAYKGIHFPNNEQEVINSRKRLAFDELFIIQTANNLIKREWLQEKVGCKFESKKHDKSLKQFVISLPFKLTTAQTRSLDEILRDLTKTNPMNRLLEGDVGSGKTVIAAASCYFAHLNGYKSLFMAPTEILANQHYQTVSNLLQKHGVKVGLQTGSKKIKKNDDFDIVIGTHALISKKFDVKKVGLVIIDEQHRFGVEQRAILKKKGLNPHLLTMTATPIPRTVALTLYGELDLSVIDEMPVGRLPIKTFLVPKHKRQDAYNWIAKQIKEKKIQAFIICPLVEESEVETLKSVRAATKEYAHLKDVIFKYLKVGLLHGRMKSSEKDRIMLDFKVKKYDVLVSTQVVEVGIDIKNATIMVIETVERYGLAQLHQLRGRVGRGDKQSYCLLFTEEEKIPALERLRLFTKTTNGMVLSEYDLKIRGIGEIYGTRQHGAMNLKIASLSDYPLIKKAKMASYYFLQKYPHFKGYEELKKRVEEYRKSLISRD